MNDERRPISVAPALPTGSSWWQLIERRADVTPDRVMLEDERGRRLSFSAYRSLAEQVAAGLAERGVRPGHVVSWQLPTTVEAAVLMGALARLGVAQNPIVPILRRKEVGLIVEQLRSDWLLVPGTWRGFDYAAMAKEVVGEGTCQVLVCDGLEVGDGELALPRADPTALPPHQSAPGAVRWFYYSSGTTAAPKGARHTDTSVLASAVNFVEGVRFQPEDLFPMAFPLTHIGGAMVLTAQLRVGSRVLLVEAFDPATSPLLMAERGATILGSALPFFHAYLAAQRQHGAEPLFPRLRICVAGGAPVPPELHAEMKSVLGTRVINAWGLTEFSPATSLTVEDPEEKFLTSAGRPVSGVEVRVVDADGRDATVGQVGELRLKGSQCFSGYVDASLDGDAFDDHGFFRTGDLGLVDEDGFVHVTGRLKDIIIRNAENISALEVENVLYEHPAVADVAVIGLPDARTGERCCAVVVLAEHVDALTLEELAEHCRAQGLANQKIPEQLELVPILPRTPMGKVLKHELRKQLVP